MGLIAFAVSFGIARAMDSAQFSLASILLSPLIEIVGSLLLGALAGFVLTKLETMFRSNSNRLSLSIAFIFLMSACPQWTSPSRAWTAAFRRCSCA